MKKKKLPNKTYHQFTDKKLARENKKNPYLYLLQGEANKWHLPDESKGTGSGEESTYYIKLLEDLSDAKRGGFTVLNIYELMPYLIDSEYKGPSTSQSYEIDTFKIERYLGYKDVLESYFFYTQINFEVAFVSIKGQFVATITKTNKEANSYIL